MGQREVIMFLEKNNDGWYHSRDIQAGLKEQLGLEVNYQSITKAITKLLNYKCNSIHSKFDPTVKRGKRRLIKLKGGNN
jgi:hypothetical protein